MTPTPQAILWDFDGTLIDSECIWIDCEIELITSLGVPWTREQGESFVGVATSQFAGYLREYVGRPELSADWFADRIARMVSQTLSAREIPWLPGAQSALAECRRSGLPMALVSASPRFVLTAVLDRLQPTFGVVVAGGEVEQQKPHPMPYLHAASQLGVEITECLIFEDSKPGSAAALASGAPSIIIPNVSPIEPAPGRRVLPSLVGVNLDVAFGLYAELYDELRRSDDRTAAAR